MNTFLNPIERPKGLMKSWPIIPSARSAKVVWLVASEHLYNITNIGLNIHSDMLCDISEKRRAA